MFIPLQNSSNQLPEISNSLRFDGSNDYLTRSYTNTTFTQAALSVWVKRSKLGANQTIFGFGATGTGYIGLYIMFNTSDQLSIHYDDSTNPIGPYTTSAVFRDPSAWYHIVIVWDTTQVTQVDRQKVWVNGTFQTTTNGLSLNASLYLRGTPDTATFGRRPYSGNYYFDGYIADPCVVFGSGLTPSSFAYTDPNGQWRSLSKSELQSVVNAGGANSFFLSFDNGASTTTLGNDASSKGNNWTLTNMVRTGGTDDCWSYDTPINNFSVLNPLRSLSGGYATLYSTGNLTTSVAAGANGWAGFAECSVSIPTQTPIYAELTWADLAGLGAGGDFLRFGLGATGAGGFPTGLGSDWAISANGYSYLNNSPTLLFSGFGLNDVFQIAYDPVSQKVWFGRNGTWAGVPGVSGHAYSGVTSATGLSLYVSVYRSSSGANTACINFGQRPVASGQWYPDAGGYFRYAPPTGYKALCTKNLPTPSILNPKKHFDAYMYNGNTTSQTRTGVGFQPDLAWVKERGTARGHCLVDSVRGVSRYLSSDATSAEVLDGSTIDLFTSDGFRVGANLLVNANGAYIAWLWKAGGAAVTNTAGSITSQVSANTAAGFSIVTYTAPASGGITVGHGLGVTPKFVVVKSRGASGSWPAWHGSFASSRDLIELNLANAKTTAGSSAWNDQFPSSMVFGSTVGLTSIANQTHVAYCFAEVEGFSKIGSYTGNGSADGPFIWCGFRPRYVLIKMTSSAGYSWEILDTARDTYNASGLRLFAESSSVEVDSRPLIDFLSNGFKLRATAAGINANTSTFLYMAFAEAPFKYANAR